MATGKRIRFFRTKIGLTQKQLGEKLGFTGRTSDVRMAQYESEARSPKQDLINQLAQIFHVDSRALTVPDIDTYVGLMHTAFCGAQRTPMRFRADAVRSITDALNRLL